MVYKIETIPRQKLDEIYEKSIEEYIDFFQFNWKYNRPKIFLIPDRKTMDLFAGHKTESWVVGWARKGNVYLLDDQNYEKESNHKYSDEEYFALAKHELAHCFSDVVSNSSGKPVWLLEGISIFLSGQYKVKPKPKVFTAFIDFFENGGSEVYKESGFAVMFLVEKYGKEKLISLLKGTKEIKTKEDFAKLFKSIYEFELSYENFEII